MASVRRSSRKSATQFAASSTLAKEQQPRESTRAQLTDQKLADKKWSSWSASGSDSPFPEFKQPTPSQCRMAYNELHGLHAEAVKKEFEDENTPDTIPHVLDAMMIAILSQATGWNNAKRAMDSLKSTYGSIYAYDEIMAGGQEKLQEALRPGGLHVRKSQLIMSVLRQVRDRQRDWSLDHLFDMSDEEAMQELMRFKGMGPKSASVVMTWCLKRNSFTVDTHIYRIAGLWHWRPDKATREKTQAHLDARIPNDLKYDLHFLLLQHGRTCPACRGGSKGGICDVQKKLAQSE